MKNYINLIYKNHSLIYKFFLFVTTTFLIVYFFPKSGKFKYSFEKGKPWQSENLFAPYDFAIKKSNAFIAKEKQDIIKKAPAYFSIIPNNQNSALAAYKNDFNTIFTDSISSKQKNILLKEGEIILNSIYKAGILDKTYNFNTDKRIIILENRVQKKSTVFANLITQNKLETVIKTNVNNVNLGAYQLPFTALFFDIIKPNLTYNETLSNNFLNDEISAVSLVRGSVDKGTLIISRGEIVNDKHFKVLESLRSEYETQIWTDANYVWIIAAYTLLVALALLMLLLFLRKYRIDVFENNTKVTFIFFNIAAMMLLTIFVINYNSSYTYIVPLCILPLILKAFFDARLGLFTHVITVLLLGFIVPNNYEYMFLQIIAGIVTILTVSELYKRANLFISVAQITSIYILSYFAFFVIHEGSVKTIDQKTFILFIISGLATLFVQPLIYAYEKIFGLVSDVSLLELSDTNSKLLKELSNTAPGTFHHSLNVANLAEAAANEIGANAMLTRVGALYHDIGKIKNPTYFTENQTTGYNPHDHISPNESASIIIGHTISGIEIAKKNKLPDRIIDFIRTHHGNNLVYYFYSKAKEINPEVNADDFKYAGPTPFSKETAILMMCDSVEAASKSLKEPTSSKIEALVESIINKQIENNQFINADITFKDIHSIKKVIKHKLTNIYHLRIEYPE